MEFKNKSGIKVILEVIGIFLIFELIGNLLNTLLSTGIWNMIFYGKYSNYLISELSILIIALIVVVITKKKDIFKSGKIKFKDAIKLGMPILVISIIMLISSVMDIIGESFNWANLFSLLVYTILIGLFEEIFYRGVIEGILLDNAAGNKKKIILSIFISSLIFGLTHLTNMLFGQDLLTTIMQVIQTFAIGILFGTIYFLSGNIWSVIFLHSFYDFSIMLSDAFLIKDCAYTSTMPASITISSLITSIILSLIYITYSYILWHRYLNNDPILKKKKEVKGNIIIWILVVTLFLFNIFSTTFSDTPEEEYYTCYDFESINIDKIETHYYSYDDYLVTLDNGEIINIYKDNDKVYLKNITEDYSFDLGFDEVDRVVVIDNLLLIVTNDTLEYTIYYSNYPLNIPSDNYMEDIKSSFIEIYTPDVMSVGYLKDVTNNKTYPMIKSNIFDIFIIKDNKLYLVEN